MSLKRGELGGRADTSVCKACNETVTIRVSLAHCFSPCRWIAMQTFYTSLGVTVSVPRLILALTLSISPLTITNTCGGQPTTLSIDADAGPSSNSSLQYHLCGPGSGALVSDTTLLLSGGVHYLEEGPFCLLQNLKNFTIQGQQQTQLPRTVIYCQSETQMRRGIIFFSMSNLHLSQLVIINCGREVPRGLPGHVNGTFAYLGRLQKAVLIITHATDSTVEDVSIDRCLGFGYLFINPLGKTVINRVSVTRTNRQFTRRECMDMLCSGSGVVVVFNDTNITQQLVKSTNNYTTAFVVMNCLFANNNNDIPANTIREINRLIHVAYNTQRIPLTGGLSIAVYTSQRSFFAEIKVSDTGILSNRGKMGNFLVLYYNMVHMSTVQVEGVTVTNNTLLGSRSRGAGLMILVILFFDTLHSLPQSQGDVYDLVEVRHSNFSRNIAFSGAALMLYMTQQNVSDIRLTVRDTAFIENVAKFGSALCAFQFQSLVSSRGAYIYMEDVTASGNTFPGATFLGNPREDFGTFVVSHGSNITLNGTEGNGCLFIGNDASVFMAVRTNVVMQGKLEFVDNHGYRGGALNLIDSSILFIHNGSDIKFTRNTAFLRGGAVYLNTLGTSVTVTCAIQFLAEKTIRINHDELQLLNISITFSNNSAMVAGNSIFGNPLYHCLFIPTTSIEHSSLDTKQALLYNKVFDFQETVGNQLSELNSVETRICVCSLNSTLTSRCPNCYYKFDRPIIPGSNFNMFLNSIDAAGARVASFLYSFPRTRNRNSSDHIELEVNQEVQPLPGLTTCTRVDFTIFAPENITLFIDLYAVIGRNRARVEVKTTFCPPGFALGSSDGSSRLSCLCSEFIDTRLESTCNLTDHTIARPTNYWVGTKTTGSYITQFVSTCPISYCREDVTDIDLRLSDQLCMEGRTGTLCGACRQSLSSVFGTAECQKCSNAWLATLILFALIGALMVISGFLLDLTITHGLINGLFFYSNIVMVNANIFFQGNQRGFLFWFLSWVNLDVGFPLCFYDGMTESAKAGLQYVFPTYIILMIAVIIIVSQRSLRMQRIISQLDGIHVLVSMFYISFLKLFRTVIDTSTFVTIVTQSEEDKIVWLFDGTQNIRDPVSIFLIILGSLTLGGFILPYMVFFTFSTYIQRCVNSTRLNAYVDASLAPYKNNLRFWFGARLILTSIIYIIIANRGTDNPKLSLTLELSLLVGFSVIQAFICPFKSLGVAILDLFFFLNLIALTLGALYTIQIGKLQHSQETIVNISLSVALLTNVGIILWHVTKRLHKNRRLRNKVSEVVTMLAQDVKFKKGVDIVMDRIGRREGYRGGNGVLQSEGGYQTGYSTLEPIPTAPRSSLGLQDMIAAPDNNQLQEEPFSPQPELREPVLGFPYRHAE